MEMGACFVVTSLFTLCMLESDRVDERVDDLLLMLTLLRLPVLPRSRPGEDGEEEGGQRGELPGLENCSQKAGTGSRVSKLSLEDSLVRPSSGATETPSATSRRASAARLDRERLRLRCFFEMSGEGGRGEGGIWRRATEAGCGEN